MGEKLVHKKSEIVKGILPKLPKLPKKLAVVCSAGTLCGRRFHFDRSLGWKSLAGTNFSFHGKL